MYKSGNNHRLKTRSDRAKAKICFDVYRSFLDFFFVFFSVSLSLLLGVNRLYGKVSKDFSLSFSGSDSCFFVRRGTTSLIGARAKYFFLNFL